MGHEGAGIVTAIGPEVTNHKIGDRVAWGWVKPHLLLLVNSQSNHLGLSNTLTRLQMQGSCGECTSCRAGYIFICAQRSQYGAQNTDQGSFSTGGVWDARYIYRIPDSMKSEDAAPLLCGGWSVWNALVGYDLKPTDHVGVVGIGGLGHFAIQLASKMGCEITAFSGTESKRADALSLGAHHFVTTSQAKEFEVARPIDRLIICTNAHISWSLFEPIMQGRGTIFPLQMPTDMTSELAVPHMLFLMKSLNVVYSTNGRWDAYDKLLGFAALHGIRPVAQKFELSTEGIEESLKRLEEGKMRYRGVLVAPK